MSRGLILRRQIFIFYSLNFLFMSYRHRCTRVENPGVYLKFLPKYLGGVKGFMKNCQGGPPILGFIAFLFTSFSKICLGGGLLFHTPLPLTLPPPCVHLCIPVFHFQGTEKNSNNLFDRHYHKSKSSHSHQSPST